MGAEVKWKGNARRLPAMRGPGWDVQISSSAVAKQTQYASLMLYMTDKNIQWVLYVLLRRVEMFETDIFDFSELLEPLVGPLLYYKCAC